MFSKAAKIWIVQNHLRIPGLTQLHRDYIAFFGITNKKSVPGVCAFKRVIEKFQTHAVPSYLKDKFQGRVVSHKTDFPWPPKSPDFNPLYFYFWGVAEKEVCDKRPKSLNQLKLIVKNFAREIAQETLFKVADNFRTRAEFCL